MTASTRLKYNKISKQRCRENLGKNEAKHIKFSEVQKVSKGAMDNNKFVEIKKLHTFFIQGQRKMF